MTESDRNDVFAAQTENVRALEQAWRHINKTINAAYSNGDLSTAEIHTKLLALVYCAFAEAIFSKVIHTPNGLTLDEIAQIKLKAQRSIVEAWKKCVELALYRVQGKNSGHIQNTRQKINWLIDSYIQDPSLLRNKLAHGQWRVALNRENTKIHTRAENGIPSLTDRIQELTVIELYRLKEAFQSLFRIVEDIIESPNKAHHRDYWGHITNFEESQEKMKSWTLAAKITSLKAKKERTQLHKKA